MNRNACTNRFGFAKLFENKKYIPLIAETRSMTSTNTSKPNSCVIFCLNLYDCSLVVFNKINQQCIFYNLFPLIDQELVPDENTIVYLFEFHIQLPSLVADTNWLLSRFNSTMNKKTTILIPYSRCLSIDIFGYLISLEIQPNKIYVNRYDRTNLMLIKQVKLSVPYTDVAMLTYYDRMIFISGENDRIYIFDHVNFTLLGEIRCGSNVDRPRNLIFMESQKLMIVASTISDGSLQALLKVNDTFFYLTTILTYVIYSYQFDGQSWTRSLYVNVSQTLQLKNISVAHIQIDSFERRWVSVQKFGIVLYDQWGTCLGKWKMEQKLFDLIILNDYRIIASENSNSSLLTLYDPQIVS